MSKQITPFTNIDDQEFLTWSNVLTNRGYTPEESIKNMVLIDDLLNLQRISSLLIPKRGTIRKHKKTYLDMISERLSQECKE